MARFLVKTRRQDNRQEGQQLFSAKSVLSLERTEPNLNQSHSSRAPYSFIEETDQQRVKNDEVRKQPQHLFTLEHPFADQSFYDDEDYVDGQGGRPGSRMSA